MAQVRNGRYAVKVAAPDFESYRGGATVEAIEDFLKGFSFQLVQKSRFAGHPSGGGYFDLLFGRLGALGSRVPLSDNGNKRYSAAADW